MAMRILLLQMIGQCVMSLSAPRIIGQKQSAQKLHNALIPTSDDARRTLMCRNARAPISAASFYRQHTNSLTRFAKSSIRLGRAMTWSATPHFLSNGPALQIHNLCANMSRGKDRQCQDLARPGRLC
jgi:hypothetical protein